MTLGILTGLGRFQELGIYGSAALASGVTVDEIKESVGSDDRPLRHARGPSGISGCSRSSKASKKAAGFNPIYVLVTERRQPCDPEETTRVPSGHERNA